MDRKKQLTRLATVVLAIFLINTLALKFHWYYSIWFFDMPMHFAGGFWLGLVALYLFSVGEEGLQWDNIWKILAFTLVLGLGWEVFEFLVDKNISLNPFNILDTTSDLFFDLAGSVLAILYSSRKS